jgi:hypothetical protein
MAARTGELRRVRVVGTPRAPLRYIQRLDARRFNGEGTY